MQKDRVAILIKKTAVMIDKLSNQVLSPYNLSYTQYKIMMMLYRNEDRTIRQTDIEDFFSFTNPTVTGIVKNLERNGMVERIKNPEDGRSKLLCLTDKAYKLRDELIVLGEKLEKQVTEELTEDESILICELLKKILKEE